MRNKRKEAAKTALSAAIVIHQGNNPNPAFVAHCDFWDAMETVNDELLTLPGDSWCDAVSEIIQDHVMDDYPNMSDADLDFIRDNHEDYRW